MVQQTTTKGRKTCAAEQDADHRDAIELLAKAPTILNDIEQTDFFTLHVTEARRYPTFYHEEIAVGELLGYGGFGAVFQVDEFILKPTSDVKKQQQREAGPSDDVSSSPAPTTAKEKGFASSIKVEEEEEEGSVTSVASYLHDAEADIMNARQRYAASHNDNLEDCAEQVHYEVTMARKIMTENVRRNGIDARYAIKLLRHDHCESQRVRGMIDAAMEIKLLSRLCHPNIVKMRGYCTGSMLRPDFFFIMDRLYETLDQRIDVWRNELYPRHKSRIQRWKCQLLDRGLMKEMEHNLMMERELVVYDLASAYSYMHEKRLVYRDIKQQNIGFDVRGDVKIFDFGLCRGLTESLRAKDDSTGLPVYGYTLSPRTGSLPYFAPEVVECKPYDSKCDVFSFAILMWEIFTLQKAFKGITHPEYLRRVVMNHERPRCPWNMKPLIKLLVREAWEHDPRQRITMNRIATMFRADLIDMSRGDECVVHRTEHMVNRSRHSMILRRQQCAEQHQAKRPSSGPPPSSSTRPNVNPTTHGDWTTAPRSHQKRRVQSFVHRRRSVDWAISNAANEKRRATISFTNRRRSSVDFGMPPPAINEQEEKRRAAAVSFTNRHQQEESRETQSTTIEI